jgi:hypothetical protein
MIILGGDCAIVLDHPQEEDEEKEVNQNRKTGQKFLTSTTHDDQSRQSLNNWMTRASIPPTPPLCPTLKLQGVSLDAYEEKMAHTQRLMGELKGSVEGFKIRIEVESEGWRGRMEVLKNELQTLRREQECGMAEAKRNIQKEIKAKLGEFMAATAVAAQERMSGEKEQVR